MRRRILIGSAWAALALGGCGGGGDTTSTDALGTVRLQVTAPRDGALVRGGTVEVHGTVSPVGAQVRVLGRPALVTEGRFVVTVPLEPGANVVDVAASAGRRTPAFAALRITRDVFVTVPDLAGAAEGDLAAQLQPLGLRASIERAGGILEALRGGERTVCGQQPSAGTRVLRGRAVRVQVAKSCPG